MTASMPGPPGRRGGRRVQNVDRSYLMARKITPTVERFWRLVTMSGTCWLWTGVRSGRGYGLFCPDGTYKGRKANGSMMAHRYAYQQAYGLIPEGQLVCHHCDVKLCVRPTHLFLGTPKHNTLDMMKKGRYRTGPNAPCLPQADRHHNLPLALRVVGTKRRFPEPLSAPRPGAG